MCSALWLSFLKANISWQRFVSLLLHKLPDLQSHIGKCPQIVYTRLSNNSTMSYYYAPPTYYSTAPWVSAPPPPPPPPPVVWTQPSSVLPPWAPPQSRYVLVGTQPPPPVWTTPTYTTSGYYVYRWMKLSISPPKKVDRIFCSTHMGNWRGRLSSECWPADQLRSNGCVSYDTKSLYWLTIASVLYIFMILGNCNWELRAVNGSTILLRSSDSISYGNGCSY